jgi:hypothetical protein
MFDVGEPQTGIECRAAMGRLVAEAGDYLGGLPRDVFFAPQGDHWSPAEHVRHLRKSTAPLARALRLPPWLLRLWFGRGRGTSRTFHALHETYRTALANGGQAGRFAPTPEPAPPDLEGRRSEILSAWRAAVEELGSAGARWPEPALDRTLLPHPLLGKLTVREMLEFTVFHTTHHLERVASRVNGGG